MKKKFVKPAISNYSIQSAVGQDSLNAICATGSYPESKPPVGACYAGSDVGINYSCTQGGNARVPNVCSTGNGVLPTVCSVGDIPL